MAHDLAEALAFDESFVAATADHEFIYFVDWEEADDEQRDELRAISALPPEEQAASLRAEIEDLDPAEREMCRQDDLETIIAWTVGDAA